MIKVDTYVSNVCLKSRRYAKMDIENLEGNITYLFNDAYVQYIKKHLLQYI